MPSVAYLDVLLDVLDAPIRFIVFWTAIRKLSPFARSQIYATAARPGLSL